MTIPNAELNAIRGRQLRAVEYWDTLPVPGPNSIAPSSIAAEIVVKNDVPALLLAVTEVTEERDRLAKLVDSEVLTELRTENERLQRDRDKYKAWSDDMDELVVRARGDIARLRAELAEMVEYTQKLNGRIVRAIGILDDAGSPTHPLFSAGVVALLNSLYAVLEPGRIATQPPTSEPDDRLLGSAI